MKVIPGSSGSDTAVATAFPSYAPPIKTFRNVKVTVPHEGSQMKWMDAHSFEANDGPISVKANWRSGVLIQGTEEIVARHFFVPDELLGKTIFAKVEIVQKNLGTERESLLLNIHPEDSDIPHTSHKISFKKIKPNKNGDWGIEIPRTDHEIRFRKIPTET